MKYYARGMLLSILTTASIQLSAQGTAIDSLKPYCMPIYKAWMIQRDLSTLDRQTVLLDSAIRVINLKNISLHRAELTIRAYDSAYVAKEKEAQSLMNLVNVNEHLCRSEVKKQKLRGRKEGAIVVTLIFIGILLL